MIAEESEVGSLSCNFISVVFLAIWVYIFLDSYYCNEVNIINGLFKLSDQLGCALVLVRLVRHNHKMSATLVFERGLMVTLVNLRCPFAVLANANVFSCLRNTDWGHSWVPLSLYLVKHKEGEELS